MTQRRQPVTPPTDPSALSRDELRRLARAARKAASPDRGVAATGRREIQELGQAHDQRREDQSLAERLAETSSLARRRGEEVRAESIRISSPLVGADGAPAIRDGLPVYRSEVVSRVRIASRGGLQLAFERGDLDGGAVSGERLLDVGRRYGWAFETVTSRASVKRDLAPITSRATVRSSAGPQEAVFAAGEALLVMRGGLTTRQIAVLDRVCGLDDTVNAAGIALQADPRTVRRALVEALTQAAGNRPSRIVTNGAESSAEIA